MHKVLEVDVQVNDTSDKLPNVDGPVYIFSVKVTNKETSYVLFEQEFVTNVPDNDTTTLATTRSSLQPILDEALKVILDQ